MAEATTPARRWDPIVRITHWSIVLAVLANAVVAEEGSPAHVWVGYALAGILSLRLLWGLVGPAEARFVAFSPAQAKHLRISETLRREGQLIIPRTTRSAR